MTWSEMEDRDFSDWKRVRSAIEHENNLVNHRLTWLFVAQGVLVALFSTLSKENPPLDSAGFIRVCVAVFGMIICGFLYVTLREADKSLIDLNKWWDDKFPDPKEKHDLHPPIQRRRMDLPSYLNLFQPQNMCFLFMLMWIGILIGLTGHGQEVIESLNKEIKFGVILAVFAGIGILIFMLRYAKEPDRKATNASRRPDSVS